MVRELKSVINYIHPDKIESDGTLYYFPFKIVPLINLIKASMPEKPTSGGHNPAFPLNFVWQSNANPGILTYQIMSDPSDEYLPVGDLCFSAPNDRDNGRNWYQNDYIPISSLAADVINAKVLFVKNDVKYCKIIKDSDFNYVADDSGGGGKYDLRIWAATSRNETTNPQQVGDYVIMSDLVSRDGNSAKLNQKVVNTYDLSLPSKKVRRVVAVERNYVTTLSGYSWENSSIGTGDWKGISGATRINYSSPFINTFFVNAGRGGKPFVFYDIVPESVARTCCSDTQTLGLLPYCEFLKNSTKDIKCKTSMNTFCNAKTMETPECRKWCSKDGNYCDDKLLEYCKTVDLDKVLSITDASSNSPSAQHVINPGSYAYNNIDNFNVEFPATLLSDYNIPYDTCKTKCDEHLLCDAFTISSGIGNTCKLYKTDKNMLTNIDASLAYTPDTNTYIKNRNIETVAEVQKEICSCFKDDQYYKNYIDKIASKYPQDVQKMLLLSTSSRDKRCFYPECTGGYSLQHKNFRENSGPCGDNNIQICFQNIQTSGSILSDSSIDNTQVNNCRLQVQSADEGTEGKSVQSGTKYACDLSNYTCVESEFGQYNSSDDCKNSCKKAEDKEQPEATGNGSSSSSGLSSKTWIIIAVCVLVFIAIVAVVLMNM